MVLSKNSPGTLVWVTQSMVYTTKEVWRYPPNWTEPWCELLRRTKQNRTYRFTGTAETLRTGLETTWVRIRKTGTNKYRNSRMDKKVRCNYKRKKKTFSLTIFRQYSSPDMSSLGLPMKPRVEPWMMKDLHTSGEIWYSFCTPWYYGPTGNLYKRKKRYKKYFDH